MASEAFGKPDGDRCRAWLLSLNAAGAIVVAPDIADYEVRRELLRVGMASAVARLDQVRSTLLRDPITTAAMMRAAECWAFVRRAGVPTAAPTSLDADCILAAQASLLGGRAT